MKKLFRFLRQFHLWSGLILALFLVLFALSGIVLNHREAVNEMAVKRSYLPKSYRYNNWNLAAVRDMHALEGDSVLIYGNIGIWLTDSTLNQFTDFNQGLPTGIDGRKTFKIHQHNNNIYAGTLYGFYRYNAMQAEWEEITLPVKEKNVVDIATDSSNQLLVLTRSHLLQSRDGVHFSEIDLPAPAGYDNKVSLFKTFWLIHSGAIYGKLGVFIVDILALVIIFLTVTGLILYISKHNIKRKNAASKAKHRKRYRWNIRWHNRVGWTTTLFLIITITTGTFLRPPLLIAIFEAKVGKIPHTELDTPNPWYDDLRRLHLLPDQQSWVLSTAEGFYYSTDNFQSLHLFDSQPPASIMGVTVLESIDDNTLLVGSFEGLYNWNYRTGEVYDRMKQEVYVAPEKKGPPVGDYMITGQGVDASGRYMVFDYNQGAMGVNQQVDFPTMPNSIIQTTPMSLWGFSQEIHTGRIYEPLLGQFYVLIVPLVGIFALLNIIAGFMIWWKYYRKKRKRKR